MRERETAGLPARRFLCPRRGGETNASVLETVGKKPVALKPQQEAVAIAPFRVPD